MSHTKIKNILEELLRQRVLIIDGAMGTELQKQSLSEDDYGSKKYFGCHEHLLLSKPIAVQKVHEDYLAAGADIIETNTFGANAIVLAEYGLEDAVEKINYTAVVIAKAACKKFATFEKPRFIAGVCGPTTKSLSLTHGLLFETVAAAYEAQSVALVAAGCDYLLFETAMDTLNVKAAYVGAGRAFLRVNRSVPIAVSATIEPTGAMLAGQNVTAFYASVMHMNPLYVGLNCATGPLEMAPHVKELARISRFPIAVMPNAGMPDSDGRYAVRAQEFANLVARFGHNGWVNIVGGCCGTTPDHIKALTGLACDMKVRVAPDEPVLRLSGITAFEMPQPHRVVVVGERANAIGSRAFKQLLVENDYEAAAEIAVDQVKDGALILDICVTNPDRDSVRDMAALLKYVNPLCKVPLMIDSQDRSVVQAAFQLIQGKAILNSINLESDGRHVKALMPLVKQFGAAVVLGCIQEEMAVTAEQKLTAAEALYQTMKNEYHMRDEDLIFDPLVFPVGTGDVKYAHAAKETIEGLRFIKKRFPNCKALLGISNVSFGLPTAARAYLNSVFMYLCEEAGLDFAIINAKTVIPKKSISKEVWNLCTRLLLNQPQNQLAPLDAFLAYFRAQISTKVSASVSELSDIQDILKQHVVLGRKTQLTAHLDTALKTMDAMAIINGPLMQGMDHVGVLFKNGDYIVAEVLRSAEIMKFAVDYLEAQIKTNFRTSNQAASHRGTLLLATVKGDVHDIGKNLVNMILGNNGYRVVDIGIKCDPSQILEAWKQQQPDMIGLSGLLVQSAEAMVETAHVLADAGCETPLFLGGAALSELFVAKKVAPVYKGVVFYCKDVMQALTLMNQYFDLKKRPQLRQEVHARYQALQESVSAKPVVNAGADSVPQPLSVVPLAAPHHRTIVFDDAAADLLLELDESKLFKRHFGLKKELAVLIHDKDERTQAMYHDYVAFKERVISEGLISAKGIYGFFDVKKQGLGIEILFKKESYHFIFPRVQGIALSDYVALDQKDSIAAMVVTCGEQVDVRVRKMQESGRYFEALALHALAVELVEVLAEKTHQRIRKEWGISKTQGFRASLGYPACPDLADQKKLWALLHPDHHIGVRLTAQHMMVPEASISALVFHSGQR